MGPKAKRPKRTRRTLQPIPWPCRRRLVKTRIDSIFHSLLQGRSGFWPLSAVCPHWQGQLRGECLRHQQPGALQEIRLRQEWNDDHAGNRARSGKLNKSNSIRWFKPKPSDTLECYFSIFSLTCWFFIIYHAIRKSVESAFISGFFSPVLRHQEQQNIRNLEFRREILEFSEISFHFDGGNLEFPLSLERNFSWVSLS